MPLIRLKDAQGDPLAVNIDHVICVSSVASPSQNGTIPMARVIGQCAIVFDVLTPQRLPNDPNTIVMLPHNVIVQGTVEDICFQLRRVEKGAPDLSVVGGEKPV